MNLTSRESAAQLPVLTDASSNASPCVMQGEVSALYLRAMGMVQETMAPGFHMMMNYSMLLFREVKKTSVLGT